MVEKKLLENAP
jgi:hypothetical protein